MDYFTLLALVLFCSTIGYLVLHPRVEVLKFDEKLSTKAVLKKMYELGYRPADKGELMLLAKKQPGLCQGSKSVVGLGDIRLHIGDYYTSYLSPIIRSADKDNVQIGSVYVDCDNWDEFQPFAAVRRWRFFN